METLVNDLRHAFRGLRKSPGFTATAIGALALGIGANTAIFSVVDRVLLKPLPYPQPERIVQLLLSSPQGAANITSVPKFVVQHQQGSVLEDITAYDFGGPGVNLTGGDRPEQLKGSRVTREFFPLFGARRSWGVSSRRRKTLPAADASSCSRAASGSGASAAIQTSSANRCSWAANPTP